LHLPTNSGGFDHQDVYIPVFDFSSINLGPNVTVKITGQLGATILSSGSASIGATFQLNGADGSPGSTSFGGGGAAGGGAVAIFANGPLNFTGNIFANGGAGGASDGMSRQGRHGGAPGGLGAAGAAGGGTGGRGGGQTAGGDGGDGGDGAPL